MRSCRGHGSGDRGGGGGARSLLQEGILSLLLSLSQHNTHTHKLERPQTRARPLFQHTQPKQDHPTFTRSSTTEPFPNMI